jgi:hypothetical protein
MKKLILVASFVIGFSVAADAQITQKTPQQRADHITKVLQKQLNLTDDQSKQINNAYLTQATRMDSLKSNLSTNKKQNHLATRSIYLSTEQNVIAMLNDNQKQQFLTWEKMKKEKHQEKMQSAPVTQ